MSGRTDAVEVFWAVPVPAGTIVHLLDQAERSRADAVRDAAGRDRTASARALLRIVCGRAFGIAPQRVTFAYRCGACGGAHGKPYPVAPPGDADLHVSVSHAADLVAVAARRSGAVGLDVEQLGRTAQARLDEITLTAQEKRRLAQLPEPARAGARTTAWVRKEALLKLYGVGLVVEPSSVDVSADLVRPDVPEIPREPVRLSDIHLHDGYRACVATPGPDRPGLVVTDARSVLAVARTATA